MRLTLAVLLSVSAFAQSRSVSCTSCDVWNQPQKPFKIYGNTYYVGPHGLGAVLIASPSGSILIDAALPQSVPQIAAHIRDLGFRVKDIKLIVTSHVHFDHAGGVADLQKLSGARVAASPWSAEVLRKGAVASDDPQFGTIDPIAPVQNVHVIHDGEVLRVGELSITAHFTPGHTPGGTSWTWKSCESSRCLDIVYADSLTPVSSKNFYFTKRKQDAHGEDFERSFAFLETAPCDILITPHPDASAFWERFANHNFASPNACKALVDNARKTLQQRLATEASSK
jgi:metallo-beta-lactamase class B